MTIVHGQSEYIICSSIRSNLRIKHSIIAEKKGKKSIQINSLMHVLNNSQLKSFKEFIRKYDDVEYIDKKLLNFKLFIIMDLDDCSKEMRNRFLNKEMFAKHWLYDYIVPIYNDPDLEETMKEAKIPIQRNEKKKYFTVFPTNHGDLDVDKAKSFCNALSKCKNSNMYEYVRYCLELINEQ